MLFVLFADKEFFLLYFIRVDNALYLMLDAERVFAIPPNGPRLKYIYPKQVVCALSNYFCILLLEKNCSSNLDARNL
jgi:hypothetical protein